jgi:2-oxoglutarate ferredoxin oxidoreductase subunit delta
MSQNKLHKILQEKSIKIPRGEATIFEERCKGCGFCIEFCPRKVLVQSNKYNSVGYHPPTLAEEEPLKVCLNCGFCMLICPEFAIHVKPRESK